MAKFPSLFRLPAIAHLLLRDTAGNTLALIAAALLPLLAMVGGGVDASRGYMAQARLQQACDAGVLAARKALGSQTPNSMPGTVKKRGEDFFNVNFPNKLYGTQKRKFDMTMETDYTISGVASVVVPTTVMNIFGYTQMPLQVECQARINFSNLDVMMVLDTTGSMAETNVGDTQDRLTTMTDTVSGFFGTVEQSATPGTRVRFGFLPYSTNVNIGHLLDDSWVVDEHEYHSREKIVTPGSVTSRTFNTGWKYVSGTRSEQTLHSSYAATFHPAKEGETVIDENENVTTVGAENAKYTCDGSQPSSSLSVEDTEKSRTTTYEDGPPAGDRIVREMQRTENGTRYWTHRDGDTCKVYSQTYSDFVNDFQRITEPKQNYDESWLYDVFSRDVSSWRTETNGCMEEPETYEITDFSDVKLNKAKDLDLDHVPNGSDKSKWKPSYPAITFERAMEWSGSGTFSPDPVQSKKNFINPQAGGFAHCPRAARPLATMTQTEVDDYLATLSASGSTYHDTGMIWGGRMLAKEGLFASQNADLNGVPTSRHLIFLTDGETAPLDISYGAYGIEPLDRRRWNPGSSLTLTETVEKRFLFACDEVRKRNITIWIIAFGTDVNEVMKECSGPNRWFQADDAGQLSDAFDRIFAGMGDLRISQ